MKRIIYFFLFTLIFAACNNAGSGEKSTAQDPDANSPQRDSMSYAIGAYLVKQIKSQGVNIVPEQVHQGFTDLVSGKGMSSEDANGIIASYSQKMRTIGGKVTEEKPLDMNLDSLSYAIGMDFSSQLKEAGLALNASQLLSGAKEMAADGAGKYDGATLNKYVQLFSREMNTKMQEKQQLKGVQNKAEGEAFLKENASKEGVKTTASGLQYKVLREGEGNTPNATAQVEVHYEGRLLDGTVFDSSYKRGQTTEFGLNQVIPGWTEGLQLMKPGAKYQFYIPSDLAYRDRGSPGSIPPHATLIFDVELVSIK